MKKALLCLFAALSMQVAAQDFSYQSVVYTITDADAGTCQTRAGFYDTVNHKDHWSGNPDHSGQLVIPATASDGDKEYTVTALGDVSFRSSSGLTSVVLPNTVKTIGNFCFDDCPSLLVRKTARVADRNRHGGLLGLHKSHRTHHSPLRDPNRRARF